MIPTTDEIELLALEPLAGDMLWRLTFASPHANCRHQLYANGRLIDVTDTPRGRTLEVPTDSAAQVLAVLAVPPDQAGQNLADLLPMPCRVPPWRPTISAERSPRHGVNERLVLRADGQADPLAAEPVWPDGVPHWGWGADPFGRGAFGADGAGAPGLGGGAFGLGGFGFGADALSLSAALDRDGPQELTLRAETPDGATGPAVTIAVQSRAAPPLPNIESIAYDPATETLVLGLKKGLRA